jgi:hypothetical protein
MRGVARGWPYTHTAAQVAGCRRTGSTHPPGLYLLGRIWVLRPLCPHPGNPSNMINCQALRQEQLSMCDQEIGSTCVWFLDSAHVLPISARTRPRRTNVCPELQVLSSIGVV